MITRITPTKLNERSPVVANPHAGMLMLGLSVAAAELNTRHAAVTTTAHIRQFQRVMNITSKEGSLAYDVTAEAINAKLHQRGVVLLNEGRACWVRGMVRTAGGTPARDLIVIAFDQDLRKRQELGRCPT